MAQHSSLVGGSTAGRILNCPASWSATMALPPSANRSSEFADEGTAMHEVMTHLMKVRDATFDLHTTANKLVGTKFYDRILTQEHLDTMIMPALDALTDLEAQYGGGFGVLAVEQSVDFPGIPGAHGTCDLILRNAKTMLHVDWKFGQGVGVKAVYRDEHGETVNAQLLFYTAGAMTGSLKGWYSGIKTLGLAIIQPRSSEPLTHVAVSRKEVKWFIEDLRNAVIKAIERDPPRQKGEWCRFAPCKINCPLWTGPLLELAALMPVKRETTTDLSSPYGAYLAKAKALVETVAMLKKEVDEQMHSYLEAGGSIPGWRLKMKAKNRQWVDRDVVQDKLLSLGFDYEDIFEDKLRTFQQVEATAKKLGVKIPDELRVAPPSTETTLATTDDPAPVIDRVEAAAAVREALLQLK
jgi:Protein of unknown function (DUF2800)